MKAQKEVRDTLLELKGKGPLLHSGKRFTNTHLYVERESVSNELSNLTKGVSKLKVLPDLLLMVKCEERNDLLNNKEPELDSFENVKSLDGNQYRN